MGEKPEVVGLLLVPGFALMSYACVVEPLRAANLLAGRELYRWVHISVRDPVATASCGAAVPCAAKIGDVGKLDLLLVCAGGDPAAFNDSDDLHCAAPPCGPRHADRWCLRRAFHSRESRALWTVRK